MSERVSCQRNVLLVVQLTQEQDDVEERCVTLTVTRVICPPKGYQQSFALVSHPKHLEGLQWYAVCSRTGRWVLVLYRPLEATYLARRYA
jgi:hypothetical protein